MMFTPIVDIRPGSKEGAGGDRIGIRDGRSQSGDGAAALNSLFSPDSGCNT